MRPSEFRRSTWSEELGEEAMLTDACTGGRRGAFPEEVAGLEPEGHLDGGRDARGPGLVLGTSSSSRRPERRTHVQGRRHRQGRRGGGSRG